MGANTGISWADDTFNPWIGCTKVSPACDGCYAENLMATRYGRVQWGAPGQGEGTRQRTGAGNWAKPLKWEREQAALAREWRAAHAGNEPEDIAWREAAPSRFVFCASLADVFDNAVPVEWRQDLFDLIRATPHLTWLLLTKRPGNVVKLYQDAARSAAWGIPDGRDGDPEADARVRQPWPRNAAIGCTVVTQEEADRDIPKLLRAKAALKPAFAFVSMEPLLGPVDLTPHLYEPCPRAEEMMMDPSTGAYECCSRCDFTGISDEPREDGLDWVITGGETDQGSHKARPSHPDWFRSLRDQCAAAGVAYHHKQNGEWLGGEVYSRGDHGGFARHQDGSDGRWGGYPDYWWDGDAFGGVISTRVGKKAAGRLLDGVTHDARPAVRP